MNDEVTIKVWDPLVRIFHWSLVVAFTVAYLSGEEWLELHIWTGYIVAGLVTFRLIWGFIGTKYAKFSSFVFAPATIIAYLKDLTRLRGKRYLGHNPAGGAMVIALLIALTGTTLTGMKVYAVEENAGPLAVVDDLSLISTAVADEDEDDESNGGEEVWEELHEFFANLTLLLVFLHIGGVLVSSYIHRENLPLTMFTGKKRKDL